MTGSPEEPLLHSRWDKFLKDPSVMAQSSEWLSSVQDNIKPTKCYKQHVIKQLPFSYCINLNPKTPFKLTKYKEIIIQWMKHIAFLVWFVKVFIRPAMKFNWRREN